MSEGKQDGVFWNEENGTVQSFIEDVIGAFAVRDPIRGEVIPGNELIPKAVAKSAEAHLASLADYVADYERTAALQPLILWLLDEIFDDDIEQFKSFALWVSDRMDIFPYGDSLVSEVVRLAEIAEEERQRLDEEERQG